MSEGWSSTLLFCRCTTASGSFASHLAHEISQHRVLPHLVSLPNNKRKLVAEITNNSGVILIQIDEEFSLLPHAGGLVAVPQNQVQLSQRHFDIYK